MQISDLLQPVTAAKADWLPGIMYLGFTPKGTAPDAKSKCEATVKRQFGKGYVLERITSAFGQPNSDHANDPRVAPRSNSARAACRQSHRSSSRLQYSSLPLEEHRWRGGVQLAAGPACSQRGDRSRWSSAFPIELKSYQASLVFQRRRQSSVPNYIDPLFQSQSKVALRRLNDDARAALSTLEKSNRSSPPTKSWR